MAGLLFPKPRPAALEREDRRKARKSKDERESDKVRTRSGGFCEVYERGLGRCYVPARHVHHLLGGIGVRGRGASALAKNKVHCCVGCHRAIHARVLVHVQGFKFRRVE